MTFYIGTSTGVFVNFSNLNKRVGSWVRKGFVRERPLFTEITQESKMTKNFIKKIFETKFYQNLNTFVTFVLLKGK